MKFPREQSPRDLDSAEINYEHWHRYLYAAEFIKGKNVLDIASGQGRGTNLLAQTANQVIGVDFSQEVVSQAAETYKRENLHFLTGSAENIPILGEKKFDVIVSFETIERVNQQMQEMFLAEIKRLLKDDGVLLMSTPNKRHYSDVYSDKSLLHIKEFYEKEFLDFLRGYFPKVALLGQSACSGSNVWDLKAKKNKGNFSKYEFDDLNQQLHGNESSIRPVYFIAVCSEVKTTLVENSFLVDHSLSILREKEGELQAINNQSQKQVAELTANIDALNQEIVRRGQWGNNLDAQLNDARAKIVELSDVKAKIVELNQEIVRRGQWGSNLDAELNDAKTKIAELTANIDVLNQELVSRGQWGNNLDAQLNDARAKIVELNQELESRGQWGNNLDAQLNDARAKIVELNQELESRGQWGNSLDAQLNDARAKIVELNQEVVNRGQWGNLLSGQLEHEKIRIAEFEHEIVLNEAKIREAQSYISQLNREANRSAEQFLQISQQLSDAQSNNSELTQEVFRRGEWGLSLQAEIKQAKAKIIEMDQEIVRRGEWGMALDGEIKAARSQIAKMSSTISWRITHPLRVCGRIIPKLRRPKRLIKVKAPIAQTSTNDSPKILQVRENFKIILPVSLQPVVSVIVPTYGQIEYTLKCLESIAKNAPLVTFEVIVVDDNSPDDTVSRLQSVSGIRLIQNDENKGFLRSCNIGADSAAGEYLLFLNNDTEVHPAWLDELVHTFQEFPGTGLVGSKLIYPDGTLQEAGCIIWQDGSAWNFGNRQDPALPHYNYAREVDYCSGASIMVPRELFRSLGGFDEHYIPAYCEDSDLALKIRDLGYRVIYQPLSRVTHHEGITSGKDVSVGVKSYQVENLKKQFHRWEERLRFHQPNGVDVDSAKDRGAKRRVLIVDKCTPTPDQDGGSIDILNIALTYREMGFQVTFIPEDNFLYMPRYTTALQRAGIEILYAPYCRSVKNHLKDLGKRYDLVMLVRAEVVGKHLTSVRRYCPQAKVVFHTVDLHFLRMEREAKLFDDAIRKKAAEEMKTMELTAIASVDATTVLSTLELEYLLPQISNQKIHLLPFCRHSPGTNQKFTARRHIVFVGGYGHPPNVDAVEFFVANVMPILRIRIPGVHFYIVGSKLPDRLRDLAAEDVVVVGHVEDLTPLLDSVRVSVAPLRYGAGIKGKISSAMGMGLPTVATSIAAEGMGLTHGENILIADGAQSLADEIVRLYKDQLLWNKISTKGIEFAKDAWGPETAWKYLEMLLRDLGISCERGSRPLPLYCGQPEFLKKNVG